MSMPCAKRRTMDKIEVTKQQKKSCWSAKD